MQNLIAKKQDETILDWLNNQSNQLWNSLDESQLIKNFYEMLRDEFEVKQMAAFLVKPTGHKLEFSALDFQVHGLNQIAEDILRQLRYELGGQNLNQSILNEEIKKINLSQLTVFYSFVEGLPKEYRLLIWAMQKKERNNRLTPVLSIEKKFETNKFHELQFLISQMSRQIKWIKRLDNTQALLYRDDLTNLFNYRYLEIYLESEIRRAHRFESSFSLLFIDVDHFKSINDQYGHQVGSQVLKMVADLLQKSLRAVDTVIRYGGDEFIVVLLGATSSAGLYAGERIRKIIESNIFIIKNIPPIKLTLSIGVAAFPEHAQDKESLIKLADSCMYQGKRAGKNRVCMLGSENNNLQIKTEAL